MSDTIVIPGRMWSPLAVGQRFEMGTGKVYEIESLDGPDSQCPIVMRTVMLAREEIGALQRYAESNRLESGRVIEEATARRMNIEARWFERKDVRKVP